MREACATTAAEALAGSGSQWKRAFRAAVAAVRATSLPGEPADAGKPAGEKP